MSNAAVATQGSVDVATGPAVQMRPRNSTRRRIVIKNLHATQTLFVGPTNAVTAATGFPVTPAGGILDDELEGYTGPVFGVGSGAGTNYAVWETG